MNKKPRAVVYDFLRSTGWNDSRENYDALKKLLQADTPPVEAPQA